MSPRSFREVLGTIVDHCSGTFAVGDMVEQTNDKRYLLSAFQLEWIAIVESKDVVMIFMPCSLYRFVGIQRWYKSTQPLRPQKKTEKMDQARLHILALFFLFTKRWGNLQDDEAGRLGRSVLAILSK